MSFEEIPFKVSNEKMPDLADDTPSVDEFGSGVVAEGEAVENENKSEQQMNRELNRKQRKTYGSLMMRLAEIA